MVKEKISMHCEESLKLHQEEADTMKKCLPNRSLNEKDSKAKLHVVMETSNSMNKLCRQVWAKRNNQAL
jgi:hypothetical protein